MRSPRPSCCDRRERIAAADHARGGALGHRARDRAVPSANALDLEHAHRPVPEERARAARSRRHSARRSRGRCRRPSSRRGSRSPRARAASAAIRSATTWSLGSSSRCPLASAARATRARVLDAIGLDERGAHGLAARGEERVGHRAADQQHVGVRRERLEHGELVGDLGAAQEHDAAGAAGSRTTRRCSSSLCRRSPAATQST